MKYNDIISMLSIDEVHRYVRDGISHSYPVIGLYNDNIIDCFFLYCVSLSDENDAEGPFATLIIDSEKKNLLEYQETNPQILNNSLDCTDDEFWKADEDFEKLYPEVRSFAFSKSLTSSQKKLLISFVKTFDVLVNKSFYKIYRELFPDFFEWVDKCHI